MNKQVLCVLCQTYIDKKDSIVIDDDSPEVRYRCWVNCVKEIKDKQKEEEKEEREKYSHLTKEEQIKEKWGINFNDLEELKVQYRDGSIHYKNPLGKIYSWNLFRKYWYISENNPENMNK